MPEEVKAAEKPPSSLVGDVTRAIHDAWEFFLPATLRLLGAGLIVYWLAGKVLAGAFFTGIKAALVSVSVKDFAAMLEQYKLTSVAPVVVLFFFPSSSTLSIAASAH